MTVDRPITTAGQLKALYGAPIPQAQGKVLDHLNAPYQAFVAHAPFVVVATQGPRGLDCSPRGDTPGFVQVYDAKTLLLPDRTGNNRLDTLGNLLDDPRLALLFLVPGVGETLRVKGRGVIAQDDHLLARWADPVPPHSVVVISVEQVYFQRQRALARARLWDPAAQVSPGTLPTAEAMLAAVEGQKTAPDKTQDPGY
ncbi:MAG: MSMEG_1061 family FMN-dependent PPOX-type flavoprotein [Candidatus Competibacterales bacterium]